MQFDRLHYSDQILTDLYTALVKPRMIEEKMLVLLRQGKITKWFSGIGQEAISVGSAFALQEDEYILPMHRNLGVFTVRNMPFDKLFAQWQGKKSGYTKGRDRSFHFGTQAHHVVGMISHLGPQMGLADGIALAHLLKKEKKTTLVFTGDGATSEGDFHESVNVAAVWDLPVIFVIENNGYGLSTPSSEQFRCKQMIDKAIGYGIDAIQIDGNNVLEVYHAIKEVAEKMRENPKPILVEAMTFRMRGHEEASGTKYVPKELFEEWGKKDPIVNYENYLNEIGVLSEEKIAEIRGKIKQEIEEGLEIVFPQPDPTPDTDEELADMYAPYSQSVVNPSSDKKSNKRFINAISDGLSLALEKHPNLVLMGQDIAEYGGAFKVTEGFVEKFGKERVRNTPLCESAIVGAGLGLSINGYKAMVEMQFADFVTCGFNQIVNNLAKVHYRWGQNADVVVRMPTGAGVAAGPFHSQSNEAWFFHTAGLKIVYPSNPYDAKGLLLAAFEDPNPYIFFEHKALYRSLADDIPDDYYTVEIGKARLVTEGSDLSIVTYGMGVHWAKQLTEELGISADILDLRTLLPWDREAVMQTVKKTGKVLVCHEDCLTGGIGGEIAAWISEHCFELLDAPVMREGSLDTAVPFAPNLENNFLPKQRIKEKLVQLAEY
ncbi:MAG: dehydrogenase E1 component subunit alpha/beta [Thermoflexibacter sp.]|nr:dehydrogenase E1 component subunit alpha/beta [Thermoflexibacter sp.]